MVIIIMTFTKIGGNEHLKIAQDYNERLENELRERRRVSRLIYDFVSSQKTLVTGNIYLAFVVVTNSGKSVFNPSISHFFRSD